MLVPVGLWFQQMSALPLGAVMMDWSSRQDAIEQIQCNILLQNCTICSLLMADG
jgi:hypothetical protein